MSARVVVDASAVVTLLTDAGATGERIADLLAGADLHAPALLPFEVAQVLRRHQLSGRATPAQAAGWLSGYRRLPVELLGFDLLAERTWELRRNVSAYDASYVALAEALGAPLLTVDRRLAGASGIRCAVLVP